MNAPDPAPGISFVDDPDDRSIDVLDPDDGVSRRADRRHATAEQWLPAGAAAAVAGLVFVLVAWLGAVPVVQAVAALFPESDHTFISPPGSSYGSGGYFGIAPNAVVIVSFGTRAFIAVAGLVLGLRARRSQRSALSGACVTSAAGSILLFVAAATLMLVGLAHGHQSNFYGVF